MSESDAIMCTNIVLVTRTVSSHHTTFHPHKLLSPDSLPFPSLARYISDLHATCIASSIKYQRRWGSSHSRWWPTGESYFSNLFANTYRLPSLDPERPRRPENRNNDKPKAFLNPSVSVWWNCGKYSWNLGPGSTIVPSNSCYIYRAAAATANCSKAGSKINHPL